MHRGQASRITINYSQIAGVVLERHRMEGWLLRDPRRLAGFFVVALTLLLGIKAYRRLRRPGTLRLVYAEEPPAIQTHCLD